MSLFFTFLNPRLLIVIILCATKWNLLYPLSTVTQYYCVCIEIFFFVFFVTSVYAIYKNYIFFGLCILAATRYYP